MHAPSQASLRRMREFGVRPRHDLGQNFLIDSNILAVIGRAAELAAEPDPHASEVVLEVGGGLGVLSEYLAQRAAHLHVVEIDRRLEEPLNDALRPFANVSLHWGDAMLLDLDRLDPAPQKVVANLPYGIAAGLLLRTIEELPSVSLWVAMVQREVGERLAAAPGSDPYGATSVLAQLAGEVRLLRAVPRTVFTPVPNVDSALISIRRTGPGGSEGLRALIRGAFAHRRKSMARSLALARAAGERLPAFDREQLRRALGSLGLPADVRAERLSAEQFRELSRLLAA